MAKRRVSLERYNNSVFINCPFDDDYHGLLRACAFGVLACGFVPRCALETSSTDQSRLQKILDMIEECRYGIHDISRVEVGAGGLPRFNMPFECGLFWGCWRFGEGVQRKKRFLVLDSKPYRFQASMSDIAGQDIHVHDNDPARMLEEIRIWLASQVSARDRMAMPGHTWIFERYRDFRADLDTYLAGLRSMRRFTMTAADLAKHTSFVEFVNVATWWLMEQPGYRKGTPRRR